MALTFNFSAQNQKRLVDATCANRGYTDTVDDGQGNQIPNPLTKLQFFRKYWRDEWAKEIQTYEQAKAAETARSGFIDIGTGD